MGSFCLQEIEFFELLLVLFLDILWLVLLYSPYHEDFALPWGVTCIISIKATIKWYFFAQVVFLKFLADAFTLLSLLRTFFVLGGVAVWVWGREFRQGNIVSTLSPFEMIYEGWKVSSFGIKALWDHHVLMCPRRFVCEQIHNFGCVQLLIIIKQGWHICHSRIKIANQSRILSCSEFLSIIHLVLDVALLIREAFCWAEIGHNMVHDQD